MIDDDEESKAREFVMTVKVEEKVQVEEEEKLSGSSWMFIIPAIVAVVLVIAAVAIVFKCYQARKKNLKLIQG